MPESVQIVIGIIFLVGVYILTRYGIMLKMRRVAKQIVDDLRQKKAVDIASAVHLSYEKTDFLHVGMRDYRPKALSSLVQEGFVGKTEDGRYYLHAANLSGEGGW